MMRLFWGCWNNPPGALPQATVKLAFGQQDRKVPGTFCYEAGVLGGI
jgi:hypothetical protein